MSIAHTLPVVEDDAALLFRRQRHGQVDFSLQTYRRTNAIEFFHSNYMTSHIPNLASLNIITDITCTDIT